jgi:putative ABC transport system permease protein
VTTFILITLYLDHEWHHDSFQKNRNSIYRVEADEDGISSGTWAPFFADKHPEMQNYARLVTTKPDLRNPQKPVGSEIRDMTLIITDPSVINLFTFEFILGDPHNSIDEPNKIVLSEHLAKKLFGEANPLGQTVLAANKHLLTVSGVYKDLPSNTTKKMDALANIKFYEILLNYPNLLDNWGNWGLETYVLFPEGYDPQQLTSTLERELNMAYGDSGEHPEDFWPFRFRKYSNIYFDNIFDDCQHGNKSTLMQLIAIALFILIIACINFVNITTAFAGQRSKEVGIKKVLGAQKPHLQLQFLIETLIMTYISIILSVTLTELLLPAYSKLVNTTLILEYSARNLFFLLLFLPFSLSLLAGIYPAIILSSYNIIEVLKGKLIKGKGGNSTRKILTVTQFGIGIFLIIGTTVISSQMNMIQQKDPGYSKEHLLYLPSNEKIQTHFESFRNQLLKNPQIAGVTRSNSEIQNNTSCSSVFFPDKDYTYTFFNIDENYMDVMGLEIIQGRNFRAGEPVNKTMIINQCMAKKHYPNGAIGQKLNQKEIIGVVNDFNFRSLHTSVNPLTMLYSPNSTNIVAVRLKGDAIPSTLKYIKNQWRTISPDYPFNYKFLDDRFDNLYRKDKRFLKLFFIFSSLAIFLACLGLFAMASFIAKQKTKEIGVRKVLGASVGKIILMLSKEFTQWVVIANLIAWPAAWYFLNEWLNNFAYHIEIRLYHFFWGALFALFIALATILSHTLKTARRNPVESLKYE